MSAENETSKEGLPQIGEGAADEATASVVASADGGDAPQPEEKRLRIVSQVEARAAIDEVAGAKKVPSNLSKISVISEQQLLGGIRVIGGGD